MRARLAPAALLLLLLAPAAAAHAQPVVTSPFVAGELKPGARLAVLGTGERYSLHDLSTAVGTDGRVYVLPLQPEGAAPADEGSLEPNVKVSPGGSPFGMGLPEPVDAVWLTVAGGRTPYLAAAFSGLKPGGLLLVRPAPADPAAYAAEARDAGFQPLPSRAGGALRFRKP